MEMTIDESRILERLVCADIPDTKGLQRIRLNSVGIKNPAEEFNKQHYQKRYENNKRLVQIPKEELMRVYSLAFPLSFSSGEWYGVDSQIDEKTRISTSFYRWENSSYDSGSMNYGSMNLTTEQGLNELLRIFTKHDLPMKVEKAYGDVFDLGFFNNPGVSVLHSFSNYKRESLIRHQFVTCDKQVIAIPFYYTEERVIEEQKEESLLGYNLTLSHQTKNIRDFQVRAAFTWPEIETYRLDGPEGFIEKNIIPRLQERNANSVKNHNNDERFKNQIKSSTIRLLKVGEPVEIFNPSWVKA